MKNYQSFAAIIYVTDTEEQAVLRMFAWQDLHIAGDEQAYKEVFIEKNGKNCA